MRPAEFEDDDIIRAGQQLLANGRRVTGFGLHKIVGGGRPDRLREVWTRHLQQCKGETQPAVELPQALEDVLSTMGQQLLERLRDVAGQIHTQAQQSADQHAEHRLTEAIAAAESQRKAAEQEVQDAAEMMTDLENQVDELKGYITELTTTNQELSARLEEAVKKEAVSKGKAEVAINQLSSNSDDMKKQEATWKRKAEATIEQLSAGLRQAEKDIVMWKAKAELAIEQFKTVQRWFNEPTRPHFSEPSPPRPHRP